MSCDITTKVHNECTHTITEYGAYSISKHFCFVWPFTVMPSANCSIFGCCTSRRKSGISIFKLPSGEDDLSKKTCEEWVNQITRNRVIDVDLRHQINEGKLHACEKHFEEKFIEKRKYCRYCKICVNL